MALLFQENTNIYMHSSLYQGIKEGDTMIRTKPRLVDCVQCVLESESVVYNSTLVNVDSSQTLLVQQSAKL